MNENPTIELIEMVCEAAVRRALNRIGHSRLLTVRQAAELLTLSEREVYSMIAGEEIPAVRQGKRLMIDFCDIEKWIVAHKGAKQAVLSSERVEAEEGKE